MSNTLNEARVTYHSLLAKYLKPQWKRALPMTFLLLVGTGLQLANPQLLRYFIDTVSSGKPDLKSLLVTGTLFIVFALISQGITVLTTYLSENLAWTATNHLRTDLVAHCLKLEMAFHKSHTSGELIERIDGDVEILSTFFSQAVVSLLGNCLLIAGILASLLFMDWHIGLAVSIFALIGAVVLNLIRTRALRNSVKFREKDAEFFGFLGEQLAGTEDIRANGATGYVMRRLQMLLRDWLPVRRDTSLSWYSMWIATLIIFAAASALALGLGAYLWNKGSISLGTVYLVFYFTNLLNEPIEEIREQMQQIQQAGAGVVRISQLLSIQPTIVDGPGRVFPPGPLKVEFRNVTFSYTDNKPVLKNIHFNLDAGRVLGILGRTGSGKTTLARLLLRLYDADQGEIIVGDVPLREATLHDLRKQVGMVTQDVQLFHASVRDNLTFFKREIADERILAVIEDLGLGNWYRALPDGLDTMLGADGDGLSAGQAQLLAFTRVFLANPGLIILDEASSRLDPATEQLIERAMNKLLEGRTAIIIAHRLTTVARADEIMVLENGVILEHNARRVLASNQESRFYRMLTTGLEEVTA